MAHVVARDLRSRPRATHKTGMHRPEAAKIDRLRQLQLLRGDLQMPEHVPAFRRGSVPGRKDKVFCLPKRGVLPDAYYGPFQNPVLIEWYFTVAVDRLRVVKVAVVQPLVDDNSVVEYVIPAKR